jgi:hypothetical protein
MHVFVCRDWRDAQDAAHQAQTNASNHPLLLFVALDADFGRASWAEPISQETILLQLTVALERRGRGESQLQRDLH